MDFIMNEPLQTLLQTIPWILEAIEQHPFASLVLLALAWMLLRHRTHNEASSMPK
jgi:hypothetical protein